MDKEGFTLIELLAVITIMGILMLAAACGTELKLQTEGADEEQALVKMVEIFSNGFGEEI